MKHIVQFSGGAASTYVAKMVIDLYGRENTILIHNDTKAEDPDTYRFIDQVSDFLNHPITDASDGRSLWELVEKYGFPSTFLPFCTDKLKQQPTRKFLKALNDEFIMYNGFGADEWRRVQKSTVRANEAGYRLESLLFENRISKEQIMTEIPKQWGICLPNAYRYFKHNNCIPCFKGGKAHWHKVWKYYPEKFNRAKDIENTSTYCVFRDISLEDLARRFERNDMASLFDQDEGIPCMCAG